MKKCQLIFLGQKSVVKRSRIEEKISMKVDASLVVKKVTNALNVHKIIISDHDELLIVQDLLVVLADQDLEKIDSNAALMEDVREVPVTQDSLQTDLGI